MLKVMGTIKISNGFIIIEEDERDVNTGNYPVRATLVQTKRNSEAVILTLKDADIIALIRELPQRFFEFEFRDDYATT